jgi:hypothetical protein
MIRWSGIGHVILSEVRVKRYLKFVYMSFFNDKYN